jgi:predicted MFS family arabinose efflux permease
VSLPKGVQMSMPQRAALTAARPGDTRLYRAYVLAILVVVYTFNFIDRMIVAILAPPIKADLALSDTQLGLLGGTAFALFYTGLGVPIAWLADRFSRTWIMTAALALWSAFTAGCGVAQSFTQLFLARLGVGVGEAGGVAPAYSLIADYFPPAQRARALAVYSFGIPLGSALGLVFGGLIASAIDWRAAFFVVGLAGLLLAPVFRLTVREPMRGGLDAASQRLPAPPMRQVLGALARKPAFWLLAFGAASSSIMGYGLFFWVPSLFVRSYGLDLVEVSLFFGGIVLIGGTAGIWLGGSLADRYGAARRSAYALVPAAALLACVPFYALGVFSPALTLAFFVFLVPTALGLVWLGPVLAAVQHLVVPGMRATASAVFLFVNNLIGIGGGTLLIGALSDALSARFGAGSLRYAILAGTSFYVVSAGLLVLASRHLERDWEK